MKLQKKLPYLSISEAHVPGSPQKIIKKNYLPTFLECVMINRGIFGG